MFCEVLDTLTDYLHNLNLTKLNENDISNMKLNVRRYLQDSVSTWRIDDFVLTSLGETLICVMYSGNDNITFTIRRHEDGDRMILERR